MAPQVDLVFQLASNCKAFKADGSEVKFTNRKVLQVAVVLALRPGLEYDRSVLAQAVWSDSEPEASLASLRNALAVMRRDFESHGLSVSDLLHAGKTTVSLARDKVTSDVQNFRTALERARTCPTIDVKFTALLEALKSPVQNFAPQFTSPWFDAERVTLDNELMTALSEAVDLARKLEKSSEIADLALNLSKGDLESEPKAQLALKALIDADRCAEALKHYRSFEKDLRERFAISPSAETVELARVARFHSLSSRPMPEGNVISALPPFFGREADLDLLMSMVQPGGGKQRVVSVVGPGGVGKTRTALEIAQRVQNEYQGSVYFVDLSSVTQAEDVIAKVAETIRGDLDVSDPLESLRQTMTSKFLLILDNLEQIDFGVGNVVLSMLQTCPTARVLATSRRGIGIPGEVSVRLGALPLPESIKDVSTSPSVQLFYERALDVAPNFGPPEPQIMMELVRKLEGLPLAICLAAAKSDVLTPSEILGELEERFRILESTDSKWPERHKSLWACIDWSYRAVPETHSAMKQMSAFAGGWTTELCEWALPDVPMRTSLQTLLRANLVFERQRSTRVRFDMFPSVREFVRANMTPEETVLAEANLARAVKTWIAESRSKAQSFNSGYIEERTNEYQNFKKVSLWALQHEPELAVDLANSLTYYWWSKDKYREGQSWLESAIAHVPESPTAELAMAFRGLATMYTGLSEYESAIRTLEKGFDLLPADAGPSQRARYLNSMGNLLMRMERFDEALQHFHTAVGLCESSGDSQTALTISGNIGFAHYLAGNLVLAERTLQETIALLELEDNDDGLAHSMHNFGLVACARGDYAEAESRMARARNILEGAGLDPATKSWLTDAGVVAVRLGKLSEALKFLQRSATGVAQSKGEEQMAECIEGAAEFCAAEGDLSGAVAFLSVVVRAKDPPQRSLADRSPRPSDRLIELKSKLDLAKFRTAELRFRGLTLREVLDEIADLEST